jgi:disulfide bond formation protein DsbB
MSISHIIKNNFWKIFFSAFFIFSLSSILLAFVIDYVLGFDPCILCIFARIPYALMIIFSGVGIIVSTKRKNLLIALLACSGLGFFVASYHAGVERHIWSPVFNCAVNLNIDQDTKLDDFLIQLNSSPLADCSKPAFHLFGLSLAEINIIINLGLFLLLFKLYKINEKTNF